MIRAKKSFGQHWLVDETVARKIVEVAQIQPGEYVLEVGPGTGALTQALVNAHAHVVAIEADASLLPDLRARFGTTLELIHADVRSFTSPVLSRLPYKLVANIPYNITSDLLRRFLTVEPKPTRMVLLLQKEVVDRITAVPPRMSVLSVMCQLYARCRRVALVPAGAFRPIPKVDSAIVLLELLDPFHLWGIDPERVMAVAKRGFSSRRKQLHGNLKTSQGLDSARVKDALVRLGLDPRVRAENLAVRDWVELTKLLTQTRQRPLGKSRHTLL